MKNTYLLLFSLFFCLTASLCHAQPWAQEAWPKREIRAVWLGTIGGIDWPRTKVVSPASAERQKAELCTMLDRLQEAGINVVVMQTRIRGTVIYPSRYEPWDDCLTGRSGRSPGYDPLQFAVDECHRRGMELHAWLVCIPLGSVKKQHAYRRESVTQRRASLCRRVGGEWFMRPDLSATADYIADLCREIVEKYDVDGLSLDYIRYPEPQYRYSDGCSAQQRRDNISRIVRRISERVRPVAPWVKLSSSPVGKYRDLSRYSSRGWNCYHAVSQDPQLWLAKGWEDWLFPMMYFRGDQFYPFLLDWQEHAAQGAVAAGLAAYQLDPRHGNFRLSEIRAQVHSARRYGLGGVIYYRAEHVVDNPQGIYGALRDEFYPYPALTPALASSATVSEPQPEAPTGLWYDKGTLLWEDYLNSSQGRHYVRYNVYGSDSWPVDTEQAENLLLTGLRSNSTELSGRATGRRYYAVTAIDRFGRESKSCQEAQRQSLRQGQP